MSTPSLNITFTRNLTLGLGAMDTLAALTTGRGGTYQRMADDSHVYFPSGKEPSIYIQSRDGLPFRARPNGLTQTPRHKPIINGTIVNNLWVLGPLVEGSCYYNHYVASSGAPSRLFIDAHKVAAAVLDSGTTP